MKKMRGKNYIYLVIVLIISFVIIGFQSKESEIEDEINYESQKFRDLLITAYHNYNDTIDVKKISEIAFNAALQSLDPNSQYLSSSSYKNFIETYSGKYDGVGITIYPINDTITIIAVTEGGPADSAGIMPGDKILFLNGENVIKANQNSVAEKINGEVGSKLSLIIKRGSNSSLNEYVLTRQNIKTSSIVSKFILPGTNIAYIKSIRFTSNCYKEFVDALEELGKKGMKSLIIDLRGNQGGYLEQVVKMIGELIPEGKKITYTESKNAEYKLEYISKGNKKYEKLPLIVMVDGQSASASEIFAGALQDLDRGLVVGSQTFGKGTVQKYFEFKDGSAFSLTVASYYTPSGRSIQKKLSRENVALDPAATLGLDSKTIQKIESIIKSQNAVGKLPIYKSVKGRDLLGGGGIYPDYFVKDDTTTALTLVMKSKGIFLEYSYIYLSKYKDEINKKYKNNINDFVRLFQVNDPILDEISQLTKSKNIWNEQMYQQDKEYIRTFIKSTIAYTLWGDAGFYNVHYILDKPIQYSINMIPEAEKLLY